MEKEYRVSWLKVIGLIALIIVIIAIICLIYPKSSKGNSNNFINNISLMKSAGFEYFKGNNLPDKIGSTNKITLYEMETSNLLIELKDENGVTCNKEESYVQVTKTLENEYTMKVFLSCKDNSDYIITTIYENNNSSSNRNEEEKVVPNNESNNNYEKNTSNTTSNINNGKSSNNYSNGTSTNITYNINYVDNCKNCVGTNCGKCVNQVYYTVSFNSNGGSSVSSQTVAKGKTASYVESYRDGYTFLGWYLDGIKYDFSNPVTNKITLLAKWEKNDSIVVTNKYIVSFNSNGGSYINSQTIVEGNRATIPNNPTKTCYIFDGWYTDNNLTNRYYFNNVVTRDITLYAKWNYDESCNTKTYVVSFESNGGTNIPNQYILDGYRAAMPNNPTKTCYIFDGWYTNSNLTNRYYFNSAVTRNITLYAKWNYDESCNNHTVRFNSNGGSYVNSQTVNNGGYAYKPTNPTRSGYTFVGWIYNGNYYNFNNRVYNDITLVAEWSKNSVAKRYNTYCKIKNKTYYSISYADANKTPVYTYNWSIRLDELINVKNVKVTDNYFYSDYSFFEAAYNSKKQNLISMVNGNSNNNVAINSPSMLKTYSLKSGNFTNWLSNAYLKNGYWYVDASVTVKNYTNAVKYYASNINKYVYMVPFAFGIKYTDLNDCVDDYESNQSKYLNYEVVKTYTR